MNLTKIVGILFSVLIVIFNSNANETEKIIRGSDFYTQNLIIDEVNIQIHFPKQKLKIKNKVQKVLEDQISYFHQYFNYRPKSPVHIVINEFANDANGLARVFPYNIINLNDFPPFESDYLYSSFDWIEQLVIHEYVHILTLDMTTGIIDKLRSVFGSIVKTNSVMPAWMLEGVSVWAESVKENTGRANNEMAKFEVFLQLQNAKNCNDISCIDNPKYYPFGHLRYWMGGMFLKYLEDMRANTLSCIFKNHSDGIPFFLDNIFKTCTGKNISKLFSDFKIDFINKNKKFKSWCPLEKKSLCENLQKVQLINKVDWQKGICNNKLVIYPYSDSYLIGGSHQIYDVQSNKYLVTDYPINRLVNLNNKCLVGLYEFTGQITETNFYTIKDDKFIKEKNLKNSELIFQDQQNFYPIHYKNGEWILLKNKKEYYISDASKINQNEILLANDTITNKNKKINKLEKNEIKINESTYNPLINLTPNYLMIMVSNIGNLDSTNFLTTLTDPIGRHVFDIQLDFYQNNSISSPELRFLTYSYSNQQNTYSIGTSNLYTYSLFNNQINKSEIYFANVQKTFTNFVTPQTFSLGISKQQLDDFISKRETSNLELSHRVRFINNKINAPYNSINLVTKISQNNVQGFDAFNGLQFQMNSNHSFGNVLRLTPEIQYSKFFKNDLVRGFYSAGGFSSFFTGNITHQFFAVNQGDIFGNEILTSRFNFDYNFYDIYTGWGLTPIYLKNLNLIGGIEYAKAKYIAAGKKLYVNEFANSIYYGLNLSSVLFYGIETNIKFVLTNLIYPETSMGALLFFNANLF